MNPLVTLLSASLIQKSALLKVSKHYHPQMSGNTSLSFFEFVAPVSKLREYLHKRGVIKKCFLLRIQFIRYDENEILYQNTRSMQYLRFVL